MSTAPATFLTDPTKLVDLYCRKSKELGEDDPRRELSTDSQEMQGRRWAAREGLTVRKVWTDIASGFDEKAKRTDFDGALAALAAGETGTLWCFTLDRFSRKGAEDLLKVIGKSRVFFDLEHLDSMNPFDRERIITEAERARSFSMRLSANVRRTKDFQREHGQWVSGRPPYGLKVGEGRKLVADDTPAGGGFTKGKAAALALEKLAAGSSGPDVVRMLDGHGIAGPTGKGWALSTLHAMTRHPTYAGWQIAKVAQPSGRVRVPYLNKDGKRVRVGVALVSDDVLRRAQASLAGKSVFPAPAGSTKAQHLLTDLLRCGGCGRSMSRVGRAYACWARSQGSICPAPASVSMAAVERYVTFLWVERISTARVDDLVLHAVAERWAALKNPESTEAEREARAALAAAEKRLRRLQEDRQNGLYDDPEMARLYPASLREETARVAEARKRAEPFTKRKLDVGLAADWDALNDSFKRAGLETKRDLIRLAFDHVVVRKAPHQGAKFDGAARCRVTWATLETNEDVSVQLAA
ncbi:recombinase family protein [Streptomyces sp. NPDC045470]|uniref:recombinase family protein n=1 Tax=Streptomyces sp. NPDC045470 TaxID=3155469 RepID=UPI0033DCBF5F